MSDAWSKIGWPDDSRTSWSHALPGERADQFRERLRTEPFEGAFRARAWPGTTEPPEHEIPPALQSEYAERRAWWSTELISKVGTRIQGPRIFQFTQGEVASKWIAPVLAIGIIWPITIWGLGRTAGFTPRQNGVLVLAMCAISLLVFAFLARHVLRLHRVRSALLYGECPTCQRRVREIQSPPGIGPPRCPGCGERWPCVPPPAPARSTVSVWSVAAASAPAAGGGLPLYLPPQHSGKQRGHAMWDTVVLREHRSFRGRIGTLLKSNDPRHLPTFGRPRRVRFLCPQHLSIASLAVVLIVAVGYGAGFRSSVEWLCVISCLIWFGFLWAAPPDWRLSLVRRVRCAPYEKAMHQPDLVAGLVQVHRDRTSARSLSHIEKLAGKAQWQISQNDPLLRAMQVVPIACLCFLFVSARTGASTAFGLQVATLMPMTLVGSIIVGRLRAFSLARRLVGSVAAKRCCNCQYPLAGVPDAIPSRILQGVEVGPRRCPECGAPWPLVPPPTLAEHAAARGS